MMRFGRPGQAIAVDVAGAGEAVLLLHGFTGTAASWAALAASLGPSRRLIAPDLLGHGRSDAPADRAVHALERQAAGLAELLVTLAAAPADVVGYSMGARLALVLALDHPDAVRQLVLESPSAGIAAPDDRAARLEVDERWAARLERDGLVSFVDAWQAQPLLAGQASLPPEHRARLRAERLSHDARGLAVSLRGAGQGAMTPLHDRLADLRVPTLVIAGARDGVGSSRAREVAGAIPGARLAIVDEAGHSPHLEWPDAVSELVTDFLGIRQPISSH